MRRAPDVEVVLMVVEVAPMLDVFFLVAVAVILIFVLFRFGLKQKRLELEHLERFFKRR